MPDEPTDKAERVRRVFSRIAPHYDLLNTLMTFGLHRKWRRATLRLAGGMPGDGCGLDLCCGTGDYIREMLVASGGTAHVTGVDFAEPMLELARRRFPREVADGRVKLIQADVTDLSFLPENHFDLVTSGFGLRNVDALSPVLAGSYRVLKPSGLFVSLDVSRPFRWGWAPFSECYLRVIVPALAALIAGGPREYRWLHESLATFPDRRELAGLLEQAGFSMQRQLSYGLGVVAVHVARKAC
ncbi:MAG: hypothetical protein A2Y63_05895 [Candidatus Riflebacteria bacterium RBG_13_59_9]|nr:MAG: hypothetical protein A2Y63_05895 [Candidatus Riflebacteria bacterium RBG_13_59_9]